MWGRQGRGCMDQVFAVRQVCEKYLANGNDVFWAFMNLEKAYDTIDRHGMWQMLRVYGVGGKLLKAFVAIFESSFYVDSRTCDLSRQCAKDQKGLRALVHM